MNQAQGRWWVRVRRPVDALRRAGVMGLLACAVGVAPWAHPAHAGELTAPRLTAFRLPANAEADQPLTLTVSATDDLSGVWSISATLVGPSGQSVQLDQSLAQPQTSATVKLGALMPKWLVPGDYRVTELTVYDAARNGVRYSAEQLDALGPNRVAVRNTRGVPDATGPVLLRGQILTPVVSDSATWPGTQQPVWVQMRLHLRDPGGPAGASGIASAELTLGQEEWDSYSIPLRATVGAPGQGDMRLVVGGPLVDSNGPPPHIPLDIYRLQLRDHAGNRTVLLNRKYGGETDFEALFPEGAQVTVVP